MAAMFFPVHLPNMGRLRAILSLSEKALRQPFIFHSVSILTLSLTIHLPSADFPLSCTLFHPRLIPWNHGGWPTLPGLPLPCSTLLPISGGLNLTFSATMSWLTCTGMHWVANFTL